MISDLFIYCIVITDKTDNKVLKIQLVTIVLTLVSTSKKVAT